MAAPLEDWVRSLPPVTRAFATGCVVTTFAVHLDLVNPLSLYLNFNAVFHHYQIWRLVTNFLFFDYFNINFIFHMFFLIRHSKLLEEHSFRGRTADFVFMWIFGATVLLISDLICHLCPIFPKEVMFLAPSLAFMVVYVCSRRNKNVRLSFFGLFTFNAPLLPWIILGFALLFERSNVYNILGLLAGHSYYYLEDVYPIISNRRLLRTPTILKHFFDAPIPRADARGLDQ